MNLIAILVFGVISFIFIISFVSAVEIDSCQTLDTEDGVYTLNQSVNSSGTCFVINANNITLDGAGFTINWSQGAGNFLRGVFVNNSNFTTIKNAVFEVGNKSVTGSLLRNIYLLNSEYGVIENNTIAFSLDVGLGVVVIPGIFLESSSHNNISNNNFSVDSQVQISLQTSNSNSIESNTITILQESAQTTRGVVLDASNNNTLFNNTLISTGQVNDARVQGIYVAGTLGESNGNIILSNSITIEANEGYGLALIEPGYGRFTNISNNIISTNGTRSDGIVLQNVSQISVINNTITTYGLNSSAISSIERILGQRGGVSDSSFKGGYLITYSNHSSGVFLGDDLFSNNNSNNLFQDMIINSSNYYAIFAEVSSNNTFLNVSYIGTNQSEFVKDDGSEITRKWYLDVTIQDSSNNATNEANVSATNVSGDLQFSVLTDSFGMIGRKELIEYININGTYAFWSNYTINATKSGYVSASTQTNLSEYSSNVGNKNITLILTSTSSNNENSSSSSSGGGGGYPTLSPKQTELNQGYNKIMYKDWKVSFKVNNEAHTFRVEEVTETNAKISISSETQEATLSVGQEKKFELSGNNYYDILVKLNSIDSTNKLYSKANFTIQTINEEIISPQQESETGETTQTSSESETGETTQTSSESETGETTQTSSESETGEKRTDLTWLWIMIVVIIIFVLSGVGYKNLKK